MVGRLLRFLCVISLPLLTTSLGLLSVAGDQESAECVRALQATLTRIRGNTFGVAAVQSAAGLCLAKLDLRANWDPLRAAGPRCDSPSSRAGDPTGCSTCSRSPERTPASCDGSRTSSIDAARGSRRRP